MKQQPLQTNAAAAEQAALADKLIRDAIAARGFVFPLGMIDIRIREIVELAISKALEAEAAKTAKVADALRDLLALGGGPDGMSMSPSNLDPREVKHRAASALRAITNQ